MEDAARLVNSSGGQWGYIKMVITEGERDATRWQQVFDKARQLKLIPITRIATTLEGNYWKKPKMEEAEKWARFLDSLNWVIENRYVIIFNEPNHANEWGGRVNPEEYAKILLHFAKTLKAKNKNFFILPAGLDASAVYHPPYSLDEATFLARMLKAEPDLFNYIDGWTSHSYPNPNFSSNPQKLGKISIQTYKWEMELLKRLGVSKDLPIFITETGWSNQILDEATITKFYKTAFSKIWTDKNLVAVIPFLLNYQDKPFDVFSWRVKGAKTQFLPRYSATQAIPKISGQPRQKHSLEIVNTPTQLPLLISSSAVIEIENKGQSIWSSKEGYKLLIITPSTKISRQLANIHPGQKIKIPLHLKPKKDIKLKARLTLDDKTVAEDSITIKAVDPLTFFLSSQQILLQLLKPRINSKVDKPFWQWHHFNRELAGG